MKFEDIEVGDHLIFISDRCSNVSFYINNKTREALHHSKLTVHRIMSASFEITHNDANDKYLFYNNSNEARLFERYP